MRKGFTKAERKQLEDQIAKIDDALEKLAELLREKHQRAEEWSEERSEQWFDSDNGQEFEDWMNELDFKIDQVEDLRSEIDLESFEEVL
jgi:hypothetical protein